MNHVKKMGKTLEFNEFSKQETNSYNKYKIIITDSKGIRKIHSQATLKMFYLKSLIKIYDLFLVKERWFLKSKLNERCN